MTLLRVCARWIAAKALRQRTVKTSRKHGAKLRLSRISTASFYDIRLFSWEFFGEMRGVTPDRVQ